MTTTETRPMDPEIKARWLARLRSGEIEQGRQYLGTGDARCCLGVLCDLAAGAEVIEATQEHHYDDDGATDHDDWWDYGQDGGETLPGPVQDWAGLHETNPLVNVPDVLLPRLSPEATRLLGIGGLTNGLTLAQLNDNGADFALIADVIEATL